MALPNEIIVEIEKTIKRRQTSDVASIVSEVMETLGGHDPNKLVAWFRTAGGPSEFVKALYGEAIELRSRTSSSR